MRRPLRRYRFPAGLPPAVLLGVLLLSGCSPPDRGRILVLGLDGMDPQTVDLLMSEGKMPNLARLRQEGSYGRFLSQKPLLSPILWTTIATGKTPDQHGIGHFVAIDRKTGQERPATSRMRRVKALWNIVSEAEKSVVTVGWWATWPPEEVRGAVVSDHTAYHFLFEDGFDGGAPGKEGGRAGMTWPPELADRIALMLRRPVDLSPSDLSPFVDVPPEELDRPFDFQDDLAHFRWALATLQSYRDIGLELWRTERPDLEMVYIEATDTTSHLFGHLFRRAGLGGELAEQHRRYGRTVEQMYLLADSLVGRFIEALDDRTTLVVLSDHGFQLGVLHDDPSRTRDLRRVSERFHRDQGILYLFGNRVKRHSRLDRPTLVDIVPTLLALLGLPAGRDMSGRILEEGLDLDEALPPRIATWEGAGGPAAPEAGDAATDEARLAHLRSLGYLGGDAGAEPAAESSPKGDRNLAAILFEEGKYRESAGMYRRLIRTDPGAASLRTSLAGALGALQLYDEAMVELEEAIAIDPLNVEAYHNRAVIWERRGELQRAVADYRTVLRYQPSYEPSQRALLRLTGEVEVRTPFDAHQARASELAEKASTEARRGRYGEAMRLLDEAEEAAPGLVLIYQYRSNVAYLMGDREAAVAALETALEIEPDNALFQENLKRLRAEGPTP